MGDDIRDRIRALQCQLYEQEDAYYEKSKEVWERVNKYQMTIIEAGTLCTMWRTEIQNTEYQITKLMRYLEPHYEEIRQGVFVMHPITEPLDPRAVV